MQKRFLLRFAVPDAEACAASHRSDDQVRQVREDARLQLEALQNLRRAVRRKHDPPSGSVSPFVWCSSVDIQKYEISDVLDLRPICELQLEHGIVPVA